MSELLTTIDELLEDPEPVDITTRRKNKKTGKMEDATLRLYIRRPTDIEKEMAAGAANGARRRLRAKLGDEKSEEYQLMLKEPLEDSDEDALREIWINGRLMERAQELQFNSLEEREVVDEPEGMVSAKERDEYDEAVRKAEQDRVAHLIEAIGNIRTELEAEVKAIPRKQLVQAAMPAHIETLVGREWNNVYTANIISRCTFNDKRFTKDSFKTVSAVEKLRSQQPRMYRVLADTHRGLLLEQEPTLGF